MGLAFYEYFIVIASKIELMEFLVVNANLNRKGWR